MHAPTDNIPSSRPLMMRILVRKSVYNHHPKAWAILAFAVGIWLVFLGIVLCVAGFWWGALIIAMGGLETWVAYRLLESVRG